MEKTRPDVAMKELAMMLMYLSRIVEKDASMPYAWKGYDFQVLNDLDADGCIDQGRYGTKRAYILDKGGKVNACPTCTPQEMLGVNNRHLGTFHTDVEHAITLADELRHKLAEIPAEKRPLLVAESGIRTADDLHRLRECGYRGFLIGEYLMRGGRIDELTR